MGAKRPLHEHSVQYFFFAATVLRSHHIKVMEGLCAAFMLLYFRALLLFQYESMAYIFLQAVGTSTMTSVNVILLRI